MRKNIIRSLAAALGMLVLIFDSRAALYGARDGIDLCIRTLIPSLFPFFVLSVLLTGSLNGQPIRLLRPLCAVCGVPEGAESLLAVGLLGGYPVGAQNIAQAHRAGCIEKSDAERMLAFCNNAGPAFIFGILGQMFSKPCIPWMLWAVHMLSALAVGVVLREKSSNVSVLPHRSPSLSEALESSLKVMALVCGWVVFFRILLAFLERWILWIFPEWFRVVIVGILELSNGCIRLGHLPSEGTRFLAAGMLLSAGGLCVTMQTASVAKGLSLKLYLTGKVVQCGMSFLLCSLLQFVFLPDQRIKTPPALMIPVLLGIIFTAMLAKKKKISSIPAAIGV